VSRTAIRPRAAALTFADTRRGLLLGAVAGASGIGISAPAIVLPSVAKAFDQPPGVTAWVLASFTLGIGVATTLSGRALDVVGARRVLAFGVAGTVASTAVIALTPSFGVLLAGRLVQGMGTGAICIVAFSAVAGVRESARARVSGILTGVSFSMIALGPLIGAVVNDVAGWRANLCTCAVILLGVPALERALPEDRPRGGALDYRGAALAAILATATAALLQGPATHSPPALTVGTAAVAVLALLLGARHLRRRPDAFLPLAVLGNRSLLRLSLAAAGLQAAYTGLIFAAPLLLAGGRHWSPLDTGLALAPGAVIAVTGANLSGTLGARRSAGSIFAAMAVVSTVGVLVAGLGAGVATLVVVGSLLTIGPYASAQTVMLDRVSSLVGREYAGVALGTFMYLFITGGSLGAAATGGMASAVGVAGAVEILAFLPLLGALALVLIPPAADTAGDPRDAEK
jgi:MFS family permease